MNLVYKHWLPARGVIEKPGGRPQRSISVCGIFLVGVLRCKIVLFSVIGIIEGGVVNGDYFFITDGVQDIMDSLQVAKLYFRWYADRFLASESIVEIKQLIIITLHGFISDHFMPALVVKNIDNSAVPIFQVNHSCSPKDP